MKLNEIKQMNIQKQEETYGGWAWLIAAIPWAISSILTIVSSAKALSSDNGSIKYGGNNVKWEKHKEPASKAKSTKEAKRVFYVF